MANSLSGVLPEMVELILNHLELPDIRSLRFASREVNAKVSGSNRFKSFFSKKNVELRASSLGELVARLSERGIESQLEHLTVTGVLYVTEGLERMIREGTKPADLKNPCGMGCDDIGNRRRPLRVPATQADLDDAEAQLSHVRCRIREAEEEQVNSKDLDALVALFDVIRTSCKATGLSSLTLDVIVYREKTTILAPAVGTTWRRIWEIAEHVFSTSVQAWKRSAIRIERLDVFSEIEGCSVQAYDVAILQEQVWFGTFPGLKALSLSVSNRVLPSNNRGLILDADPDDEQLLAQRNNLFRRGQSPPADQQALQALEEQRTRMLNTPRNEVGVAKWLQQIEDLEELHLRSYRVMNGFHTDSSDLNRCRAIIKHIAESAPLPKLKKLTLRGSNVDLNSIMMILRNSPDLESISFREITLTASNGQSWDTVFAHLTSPSSKLTNIFLDNLFEQNGDAHNYVACFSPGTLPGDSITSGEDAKTRMERLELAYWDFGRPSAKGYNTFELSRREDVLRGIEYLPNRHYVMGSVQNSMWREYRRREYGPPGSF